MWLGAPADELAWLAVAILAGGVVTGILAGLFGIGGGAVIVPVLYEVFRILGVPEAVRMQLCIGTSLAIIVPTTVQSYRAHRARGMVIENIVRRWALPAILGVAVGSLTAAFAPAALFKIAFVLIASAIATKLLFGRDTWRIADELPAGPGMAGYGFLVGLCSALMGVSGGSISNAILTLRQAATQCGGNLRRIGCADHDCRDGRVHARRPSLSSPGPAVVDRIRLAPRRRPDGAGVKLHRRVRRPACACALETTSRDRLRAFPAGRLGAFPDQSRAVICSISASSHSSRQQDQK
jgi:Sulfite exporter TauE/SafE